MRPGNVDVLYSLAALVLIWVLLFIFWRNYRADLLRHRLSVLRDELQEFALSGGVSCSHPAYMIALDLIDDAILCSGSFTFFRLLCFRIMRRSALRSPLELWEQALSTLPGADARGFLTRVLEQWRLTLIRHLLLGMPVRGGKETMHRLRAAAGWLDTALPSAWSTHAPTGPEILNSR